MEKTMPNNLVICSDKFLRTKAPWKIDDSLMGQLKHDHMVATFDSSLYGGDYDQLRKDIAKPIKNITNKYEFDHIVFIGIGDDCQLASSLYVRNGVEIDTVFLVNNPFDTKLYNSIFAQCAIYNLYTRPELSNRYFEGAEANQYIKTRIPAHMSNRVSLEISGLLMYDRYCVDYFTPVESQLVTL
jgi:hypothetical protein